MRVAGGLMLRTAEPDEARPRRHVNDRSHRLPNTRGDPSLDAQARIRAPSE